MGAFKSFTSQDIIVSPLTLKGPTQVISTTILKGKNTTYGSIDDEPNPSPWPSASLIYASIKHLYYSNTLPNDPQPYIIIDNQGNVIEGSQTANVNSRYDNYLQNGLGPLKNFPTGANDIIVVCIISQSLFGDNISLIPGGVSIILNSGVLTNIADDSLGNLWSLGNTVDQTYVGNIIYSHGIAIITDQTIANFYYPLTTTNVDFKPSKTIYETQYKCTIRPDEFNYSQNPTLLSGSQLTNPIIASGSSINTSGDLVDFVTGSAFTPYITTVGLYNDNNELLAVAKLAQPIPTSRTVDMNIVINMDK